MTDQIKKKWRINKHASMLVESDDRPICSTGGYSNSADDNAYQDNQYFAQYIVAIHNAIIEAGIDPDRLVEDVGALRDLVKETSEICGYDGEVSGTCALDWVDDSGKSSAYVRDILDRLGVKG